MTNEIDRSFLDIDSPADREVRILYNEDDAETLGLEIDTPPNGKVMIRMGLDDAKKLATRIYAAVKLRRGELPERDPKHAH
jgi:hypothetical protein